MRHYTEYAHVAFYDMVQVVAVVVTNASLQGFGGGSRFRPWHRDVCVPKAASDSWTRIVSTCIPIGVGSQRTHRRDPGLRYVRTTAGGRGSGSDEGSHVQRKTRQRRYIKAESRRQPGRRRKVC